MKFRMTPFVPQPEQQEAYWRGYHDGLIVGADNEIADRLTEPPQTLLEAWLHSGGMATDDLDRLRADTERFLSLAATPPPERQEQEADASYKGGRWHRRSVELLSLLSDAVKVQRDPCDHAGIGRPGCATCDPRIRDNLGIGEQAAALSQPEQPKGEQQG